MLATAMIVYGAHKVFSAQFGTPGLDPARRSPDRETEAV